MSCVASRARAKSQAMQIDHGELLIQPVARAYPEVFLNYIEEKWRQTQSFLCKTTLLGFYPPAFKDTTIMIPLETQRRVIFPLPHSLLFD